MTKATRATEPSDLQEKPQPLEEVRDEAERSHILSVLRLAGGNRAQAARLLGISRKTLWKRIKRLGLRPPHVTER